MAAVVDGGSPLLHALFLPQNGQISSVGGNLTGSQIVKLKDILDELFFFVVNGTFLGTHIHHHADLLLADSLLLRIGVNAK